MVAVQEFQEQGTSAIHRPTRTSNACLRTSSLRSGVGRTRTGSTERTAWDITSIVPPTRLCAVIARIVTKPSA